MSRQIATRLGLLVLALGLIYGGFDIAGAAGPPPGVPPAGTVTVANSSTNPVPVNVGNQPTVTVAPALPGVPFADSCQVADFSCTITVPDGKQLVVQTVVGDVTFHRNSSTAAPEILSDLSYTSAGHGHSVPLTMTMRMGGGVGSFNGASANAAATLTDANLYVDGGTKIQITVTEVGGGSDAQASLFVSGYLI
jgi:hypothetical protein